MIRRPAPRPMRFQPFSPERRSPAYPRHYRLLTRPAQRPGRHPPAPPVGRGDRRDGDTPCQPKTPRFPPSTSSSTSPTCAAPATRREIRLEVIFTSRQRRDARFASEVVVPISRPCAAATTSCRRASAGRAQFADWQLRATTTPRRRHVLRAAATLPRTIRQITRDRRRRRRCGVDRWPIRVRELCGASFEVLVVSADPRQLAYNATARRLIALRSRPERAGRRPSRCQRGREREAPLPPPRSHPPESLRHQGRAGTDTLESVRPAGATEG